MTVFNSNASRLYVVKETTPGTIKSPSAGSEAIAVQPGFELNPNIESLTNETLRAGIGPSKPIQGLEKPTFAFSHYFRGSGTEGAYADFDLLLESLFGSKSQNATQRATAAACTTTLLKLAAGGGDFALGKAVLVKNAVYEIRPVDSVATNDLTLGFALVNAPGTGLNVGKCVNYTPVNSGHPLLSLWLYRANAADLEAIQGALVTQMDLNVDVGALINMSFQAGGTKFFFNPIEITAASKYIDYTDGAGAGTITIAVGMYRDPQDLASAIQAAFTAASLDTWTVTYTSHGTKKGKFTIASNGVTTSLLWNTGANTANSIAPKIGFSTAADSTGAHTYDSPTAQVYSDALTPSLDDSDPLVAKNMEILIGSQTDYITPCVQTMKGSITLDTSDVKCITAASGIDSKVVKKRNSSFEITAVLEQHEADLFDRFINNTTTKMCFNFGSKSGSNWVPGKCGCLYAPNCTITGYRIGDSDGAVVYIFNIIPFMDTAGNPEVYLNFL